MRSVLFFLRESVSGRYLDSKFIEVNDSNRDKVRAFINRNGWTTSVANDTNCVASTYDKNWFKQQKESK